MPQNQLLRAYRLHMKPLWVFFLLNFSLVAPLCCAPGGIRTTNDSSEDCCDIHFTTGAKLLNNITIIHYSLYFTKRTHVIYLYSMRHDQPQAFELRKQGKTYREIEKLLGISRSTLCEWFRNEKWSIYIKKSNIENNTKISTIHLKKLNEARRLMLEKKYGQVEEDAVKEFEVNKNDPLFMAGLMVYAGEGDKANRYNIKLANSEFYLHLVFMSFLEKFLKIKRQNIKFWLLLYPDHDIEKLIGVWSDKLNIHKSNFYKSQVITGRETKNRGNRRKFGRKVSRETWFFNSRSKLY